MQDVVASIDYIFDDDHVAAFDGAVSDVLVMRIARRSPTVANHRLGTIAIRICGTVQRLGEIDQKR